MFIFSVRVGGGGGGIFLLFFVNANCSKVPYSTVLQTTVSLNEMVK